MNHHGKQSTTEEDWRSQWNTDKVKALNKRGPPTTYTHINIHNPSNRVDLSAFNGKVIRKQKSFFFLKR